MLCNAIVAIYIYTLVPEFLLRFIAWILINVLYRIRIRGMDAVPDEGAALLVCNHISYVDALVVLGSVPRPVRFVMYYKIFHMPIAKQLGLVVVRIVTHDPVTKEFFRQVNTAVEQRVQSEELADQLHATLVQREALPA